MGRVRNKFVKRTAKKIFARYGKDISLNFDQNKEIVEKHVDFPSKKLRNVVLGYVTKLKKLQEKEQG